MLRQESCAALCSAAEEGLDWEPGLGRHLHSHCCCLQESPLSPCNRNIIRVTSIYCHSVTSHLNMIYHSSAFLHGKPGTTKPGKESSMGSFATELACRGASAARQLSVMTESSTLPTRRGPGQRRMHWQASGGKWTQRHWQDRGRGLKQLPVLITNRLAIHCQGWRVSSLSLYQCIYASMYLCCFVDSGIKGSSDATELLHLEDVWSLSLSDGQAPAVSLPSSLILSTGAQREQLKGSVGSA
jgi:hypothetical protein